MKNYSQGYATNYKSIITFLEENFDLSEIQLPDEYYYSSLPLCLLDAIYSIGVRYTSTANTVERYCTFCNINKRRNEEAYPSVNDQQTITELIDIINEVGTKRFASEIVKNKQRTSSRNGILKAEAVLQCAEILKANGIETLNDFSDKFCDEIGKAFCSIKGQKSGISLAYLKMLCGSPDTIKPDRHIVRFLNQYFDEEIRIEDAQSIIDHLTSKLQKEYKSINARKIDYIIWNYMSSKH